MELGGKEEVGGRNGGGSDRRIWKRNEKEEKGSLI